MGTSILSPANMKETTMIEFRVDDMTCGHCASTIARAVKDVDAAARCEVDLQGKRVRIASGLPAADFHAAIEEAGYTPVPLAAER
jgi:copper chaperone